MSMSMIFSRKFYLSLLSFVFLASIGEARAGLVLEFSVDGGATFGNSFRVAENSSTTVGVVIAEFAPDTILSDQGLLGFGLAGSVLQPDSGFISNASIDPVFDFKTTDQFTGESISWEAAVFLNSVPTGSRIQLGSFQFDATGLGDTTIEFGDIQPGTGSANVNWLSGGFDELDEVIFGPGGNDTPRLSFSVVAVPEPSSFALIAVGALASIGWGLRRKRRTESAYSTATVGTN